jgi:holo-[acyl-carrier protein] synthase
VIGGVILGLGSDICDIRRIERALERFGPRFIGRVFTEAERRRAERRQGAARTGTYAKRFAAKEAGAKALGTGFAQGVFMSDIGVVNLPGGKPTLRLEGGALARLHAITPPGLAAQIDVTLSDEYPYAYAHVIISAVPAAADPIA